MLLRLTIALTVAPAILVWLLDRRMVRRRDAPDFDTAWWKHRVRMRWMAFAAMAALIVLGGDRAVIAVPMTVVLNWIAAFPARRTVFDESWNLVEYLWSHLRMTIGTSGFWIALILAPWIVTQIGYDNFGYVAAGLLVWLFFSPSMFLWGMSAEPLTDDGLLERFAAIQAKARVAKPAVYITGPKKAEYVNARALPWRRPAVLLSRTLLRHFEPDEVAAIYGHEVAHLEHLASRGYRASRGFLILAQIFIACVSAPLAARFNPDLAALVPGAWAIGVLIGLALRGRGHHKHELESDARGVELCGNAEVFIRALTKTYALAKIPQRLDAATHPSLTRRIEALQMRPIPDGRS